MDPNDQKTAIDYIWNSLLKRNAEKCFVYDGDELVGVTFYGIKTKRFKQVPELNQNFKYLFSIKNAFEEHILQNEQNHGIVFLLCSKTTEAHQLLTAEIHDYMVKNSLKIMFFCMLDVLNPVGKIVRELHFPVDQDEKIIVQWAGSYFSPDNDDQEIKFGVYGRVISTDYLYRESFPCLNLDCETTILLIHGMATDHQSWKKIIPFLRHFVNVEIIDLPLHGHSNIPPLNEIHWDLSMMGLYITQFAEEHNFQNLIVWGHSLGGGVAIMFWLYYQKYIRGLILEDPYNPGALTTRSNFFYGLTQAIRNQIHYTKWKKAKSNVQLVKKIRVNSEVNNALAVYSPLTKEVFEFFNDLMDENELLITDFAYHQNQTIPTMVFGGVNDFVINVNQSETYFKSLTPNYQFILVPFANHSPHMNNPVFTEANVINYLKNVMK